MNRQVMDILRAAEGRYLTSDEQAILIEHARGMEARLAAANDISRKEAKIVQQTVAEVMAAYPDMEKKYKGATQTCTRDVTLVLRYACQAMVRQDPHYLNDTLLTWMATMLKGVGLAPHLIEDTYKTLFLVASKELTPPVAKLLQPYVLQCAAVLSGRPASSTDKEA